MKKVFDAHVHYSHFIPLKEMVDLFQREFELTHTEKMAFMSLPHDERLLFDASQNMKGLFLKHYFSPNAYTFAGLEHTMRNFSEEERADDYLRQAKEYHQAGFDGIKMLEGYPCMRKEMGIPLCHKVYDKFYSYLEENGIPIMMHIANPEENWDINKVDEYALKVGRFCDETYPTKAQLHAEVDEIMRKHPKLKLILAHFGFLTYEIEEAKKWLDNYENTMFDMTPGGEQYFNMLKDWDQWHAFFQQYQTRIVYGTDLYALECENEERWKKRVLLRSGFLRNFLETDTEHVYLRNPFRGIKMEESILDKLYSQNAENAFGSPRTVDIDYLIKKADNLLHAQERTGEYTDEDMQYILEFCK